MKLKVIGIMGLSFLMMLTGCNNNADKNDDKKNMEETAAINDDDYRALLPFQASDARQKHASQLHNDLTNLFAVGNGLMDLSKSHFSPKDYVYRENQFLTYNVLDAQELQNPYGLLGQYSKTNQIGLNPSADVEFKTAEGTVKGIAPLVTIFELDWYKGGDLSGISISIVLNNLVRYKDEDVKIDDQQFQTYAEDTGRKAVNYLRKTHPEIGNNMPIYVTLFNVSNVNESLPGTYFGDAYFNSKTVGAYNKIEDAWVMFPTSEATKLDASTSTDFLELKSSIDQFFPEDISIIGLGHYRSDKLIDLDIDIVMHAKTAAEVSAAVQYINSNLSAFSTTGYRIRVSIKCDNKDAAVIERESGTTKTTVIELT